MYKSAETSKMPYYLLKPPMILRSANETFIYIPLYFELFSNLRQDSLHDWRCINISAMTLPRYTAENCAFMMTEKTQIMKQRLDPDPLFLPLSFLWWNRWPRAPAPSASGRCSAGAAGWHSWLCTKCRAHSWLCTQRWAAQLVLRPKLGTQLALHPMPDAQLALHPTPGGTAGYASNAGWHSWLCTKQLVSVLTSSHFCSRFTLVFALSNGVWRET